MLLLKKPALLMKKPRAAETIIPLDSLPPAVREKIEAAMSKNDEEDDDSENNDEDVELPFFPFMRNEQKALEDRGIFLINGIISKENLKDITSKLLSLNFDGKFNDEVQIIINSPGGFLDACWAFIDVMDAVRMPIRTVAMGEICSAGAMIFVAGDYRVMAPNSTAMIHHFSTGREGTYPDLVSSRKYEDMEYDRMVRHFLRNSKYETEQEVIDNILLDSDNYLTPTEMKHHGMCDVVLKHRRVKKTGKKQKKTKKGAK